MTHDTPLCLGVSMVSMLLKWNSTHDVNSVRALEKLSSAYPPPYVPEAKLLHVSTP
jgi:hypothetical protein